MKVTERETAEQRAESVSHKFVENAKAILRDSDNKAAIDLANTIDWEHDRQIVKSLTIRYHTAFMHKRLMPYRQFREERRDYPSKNELIGSVSP